MSARKDWARVQTILGSNAICERCGATLATYIDRCSADPDEACPGFLTIERVMAASRPSTKSREGK